MKALLINCTLKPSPEKSNTEALGDVVAEALRKDGVEVSSVRAVDHSIPPGVETSIAQRVLERMDAMISETDDEERPVGFTIPGQAWTYWNKGPGPIPAPPSE